MHILFFSTITDGIVSIIDSLLSMNAVEPGDSNVGFLDYGDKIVLSFAIDAPNEAF